MSIGAHLLSWTPWNAMSVPAGLSGSQALLRELVIITAGLAGRPWLDVNA
jgi:hypothetical protein